MADISKRTGKTGLLGHTIYIPPRFLDEKAYNSAQLSLIQVKLVHESYPSPHTGPSMPRAARDRHRECHREPRAACCVQSICDKSSGTSKGTWSSGRRWS